MRSLPVDLVNGDGSPSAPAEGGGVLSLLTGVAAQADSTDAFPPPRPRGWSIRHRLALAVLAAAVPLSLLLAASIWEMAQESAEAQRANMLSTAHALAAAVDAKIDKHITLGRTLASARWTVESCSGARSPMPTSTPDTPIAAAVMSDSRLVSIVATLQRQPRLVRVLRLERDLVLENAAV